MRGARPARGRPARGPPARHAPTRRDRAASGRAGPTRSAAARGRRARRRNLCSRRCQGRSRTARPAATCCWLLARLAFLRRSLATCLQCNSCLSLPSSSRNLRPAACLPVACQRASQRASPSLPIFVCPLNREREGAIERQRASERERETLRERERFICYIYIIILLYTPYTTTTTTATTPS